MTSDVMTDGLITCPSPSRILVAPCADMSQLVRELHLTTWFVRETTHTEPLVWISLTNGLEALECDDALAETARLARLSSTLCEQADYHGFARRLADEFLLAHALGRPQIVIDLGAKRIVPRSFRQGIPYAERIVHRAWELPVTERSFHLTRTGVPQTDDAAVTTSVDRPLPKADRTRLDYFKRFLADKPGELWLLCAPSAHDGDYEHWVEVARATYGGQ